MTQSSRSTFSFHSASVDAADRFDIWREFCSRAVLGQSCVADAQRFDVALRGHVQPGISAMQLHAGPCSILRDPDRSNDDEPDLLAFYMVQAGTLQVEQDGRVALLRPGEATLCVGDRPYRLTANDRHEVLTFKVRRQFLSTPVSLEGGTARNLVTTTVFGRSVAQLMQGIWSQLPNLDNATSHRLVRNLVDLTEVALALEADDPLDPSGPAREANVRRIRQFIDCNLGRDDLTAARVAIELNLSPRYINKVLAAEGTSLIRHLWHRRITMAAEQLREPRLARRSISAIAFSLGFKNLSHFSDLFRRTYGVSPTEYRGQHPR